MPSYKLELTKVDVKKDSLDMMLEQIFRRLIINKTNGIDSDVSYVTCPVLALLIKREFEDGGLQVIINRRERDWQIVTIDFPSHLNEADKEEIITLASSF